MYNRLPLAMLTAVGLAFAGALAGPAGTSAAHAQEAGNFSDAKLRAFAQAAVKLNQIRSEFQSQMGSMESDQERQQLQQRTNQRMAQAVKQTEGISIEEYNKIATQSRGNQALAEKINKYIKESGS